MVRWLIILLETVALIYILLKNREFNYLLHKLLNAIPPSTELKGWILKGVSLGAYFTIIILGAVIFGTILYYLIPYVRELLNKETLIEQWEEEFIKAKQAEINEIEKLRKEAQKKLQEAQKQEQELHQQITHYQYLSRQLKQKEAELEIEFQQKRESYLQELSGLRSKNRELQARIKHLKEQLKSCREKLKKR